MRPYYRDDWVTLYHGDCRAVMPELCEGEALRMTGPEDMPLLRAMAGEG